MISSRTGVLCCHRVVSRPGVFGLILAALTAALMSTVDTLITAVSAIVVNDVYKPYIRPEAADRELLRVARVCAVSVAILGVVLVPLFMMFDSIYEAHGAFTAAVTPPLLVTLLLSVFWRRFTRTAALCTLVGGLAAVGLSIFVPEVIRPFAHGVPMQEVEDGFLSGNETVQVHESMLWRLRLGGDRRGRIAADPARIV